jgi:serine/threonine protein kinase
MIEEKGHNREIDYWALGVLIYEMIVGIPPYYHKNRETMFTMIKTKSVKYPDLQKHGIYVSEEAKDVIDKLLTKNPKERLGSKNMADEILEHPFFASLDIPQLLAK